jgi:hypothetical protein
LHRTSEEANENKMQLMNESDLADEEIFSLDKKIAEAEANSEAKKKMLEAKRGTEKSATRYLNDAQIEESRGGAASVKNDYYKIERKKEDLNKARKAVEIAEEEADEAEEEVLRLKEQRAKLETKR